MKQQIQKAIENIQDSLMELAQTKSALQMYIRLHNDNLDDNEKYQLIINQYKRSIRDIEYQTEEKFKDLDFLKQQLLKIQEEEMRVSIIKDILNNNGVEVE